MHACLLVAQATLYACTNQDPNLRKGGVPWSSASPGHKLVSQKAVCPPQVQDFMYTSKHSGQLSYISCP